MSSLEKYLFRSSAHVFIKSFSPKLLLYPVLVNFYQVQFDVGFVTGPSLWAGLLISKQEMSVTQ